VAILADQASEDKTSGGKHQLEEAIHEIEEFGVSFDGHQYRYRGYGYS
jgi:hypothetical protein